MFARKKLREKTLELQSAYKRIDELDDYIKTFRPLAVEDELISYCRVFGKRIPIEFPDDKREGYFENAILFDEPVIFGSYNPLLGICYNPDFDICTPNDKQQLLKGRHLGLEGIVSLSYLLGDEAEYKPWTELGPVILNLLREKYKV